MFKFILLNFFPIFQPSTTNELPSLHADHPPEFSETSHQDQISDLLVSQCDCRERLKLRRFSLNRVHDCSANLDDVAKKRHVLM